MIFCLKAYRYFRRGDEKGRWKEPQRFKMIAHSHLSASEVSDKLDKDYWTKLLEMFLDNILCFCLA